MINPIGGPLTPRDLEKLEARWIDGKTARQQFLRRVTSIDGAVLAGRNGAGGDYAGIAIPNVWPGSDSIREYRLRRDHPEIENGKVRMKYVAPPGRGNLLYFPIGTDPAWLTDPQMPLVITEGEFKTLALARAARHGTATPRFLAVGLSGVWNWRGTVGKTTDADGHRIDVKGAIPDLSRVICDDRQVLIVFDADLEENDSVRAARFLFTQELRSRAAQVSWFNWPADRPAGAKGIDDYLAVVGPEPVLQLIEAALKRTADPLRRETTNVDEIAQAIKADHHFARDPGGRLYVFKGGVYKPVGELLVRQRVKGIMTEWGLAQKWSTRRAAEVVEYIRVDCPELWADPPVHTLNVLNGLLDIETRKLRPHDPEFLSAVQIPVTYDPRACCPVWNQFVADVFPADSEEIAWEIPTWLMTPENSIQKAVLLLGEGANGKSTYLRACAAFIGKHNTVALSLHKLEQDKFAAARLVGKLANICPDLPTAHLTSTSMFKALTGGDVLSAEYKFRDSFEYVPFAKLVFSANTPPHSDDATHGFFRRWQVVPFLKSFEDGDPATKTREELDAALANPTELSGVLNKALQALRKIRKAGFTQSKAMQEAWEEFRNATDPLAVWLAQATVQLPNVMISQTELRAAFNKYMEDSGKPGITKTAFGLALKRAAPTVEGAQRTLKGISKQWVYCGICLKTEQPSE